MGHYSVFTKNGIRISRKGIWWNRHVCKQLRLLVCICLDKISLDFLDKYDLKYNKIASAMIVDEEFLELVAKKRNIPS